MNDPVSAILDHKGRQVATIAATATVIEAVRAMNGAKIGSVVVLDGEIPVGIFTERDVLTRVVDSDRKPAETRVSEVMTRELAVIGPDTQVSEAAVIMTETRCRHLPVVEGGKLHGLVSIGDVTRWNIRDQRHTIADLVSYIAGEYPR